jgi:hypothetical protein
MILCGLSSVLLPATNCETKSNGEVVRFWRCPPGKQYWREHDNFGPYAASWPTYAVIVFYARDVRGKVGLGATPDSTLFLMSHPELRDGNLIEMIPRASRFAAPCRSDANGLWVRFAAAPVELCFVLAEATGGNCGDQVRVFGHMVSYDTPHIGRTALQDHTFDERFEKGCILRPLVADIDGDGIVELLLQEQVSTGDSEADARYRYRIYKWQGATFSAVGEIADSDVQALENVTKL